MWGCNKLQDKFELGMLRSHKVYQNTMEQQRCWESLYTTYIDVVESIQQELEQFVGSRGSFD